MNKILIILFLFFATIVVSAQDYQSYIDEANAAYFDKNFDKAVESFQAALKLQGDIPFYNAACVAALAGKTDLAFEWLTKAFNKGFYDARQLQKDDDLLSLHSDPRWQDLVEKMQKEKDKIEENYDKQLQERLLTIFDSDQKIRQQFMSAISKFGYKSLQTDSLAKIMMFNDSINLLNVKEILDKYGWVGEEKVGKQANAALWLVIQHADLATQQKYLPMLREAVTNGKASAETLAMLEDRVLVGEGKAQIYGTQLEWNEEKQQHIISPLSDPDNVDVRRANVGLPPLADYLKNWGISWDVEKYKQEHK